jgi:hypothetical protein
VGEHIGLQRPHWSFWAVGIFALIFNCAGVANFFSQMNAESVAALPDIYRSIIESRAVWATAAFALAVIGGTIGCLLLLFRKAIARYLFLASLLGAGVTLIDTLGIESPIAISAGFVIGNIVQLAVTVFLVWYSMYAERKSWIS